MSVEPSSDLSPQSGWNMVGRRVLVLAPHTDDAELACGGTMARFQEEGAELHLVAFSTATESLPSGSEPDRLEQEFLNSSIGVLGIDANAITVLDFRVRRFSERRQDLLESLVDARERVRPNLVLAPSGDDIHQDHWVVHREAMRAFKETSMLCYEMPWNQRTSVLNTFIALQERHVAAKVDALQQYRSQLELGRPYMSPEFIRSWAHVRGVQSGSEYAEAFELHLMVWS